MYTNKGGMAGKGTFKGFQKFFGGKNSYTHQKHRIQRKVGANVIQGQRVKTLKVRYKLTHHAVSSMKMPSLSSCINSSPPAVITHKMYQLNVVTVKTDPHFNFVEIPVVPCSKNVLR